MSKVNIKPAELLCLVLMLIPLVGIVGFIGYFFLFKPTGKKFIIGALSMLVGIFASIFLWLDALGLISLN